jgi:hypothetical protein
MEAVLEYDPMEAVVEFPARPRHPAGPYRQPRPRPVRRPGSAVLRRRRILAALAGLGLVLTVVRAGAAFEGSSLATPERLPHVRSVVVEPGDSLWSVARELAPERDPRTVVDAIVAARGGETTVVPGETINWRDS